MADHTHACRVARGFVQALASHGTTTALVFGAHFAPATAALFEAAEAAGRPITAAQLVAFACAVGLLGACIGATSTWFQSALRWVASSAAGFHAKAVPPTAMGILVQHGPFIVAMAALFFLVSTAVYLALGRD